MDMLSRSGIAEPMIYPCPHCRAELEAREDDGWPGWRRCPACDLPLLPPDPSERASAPWKSVSPTHEEILRAGSDSNEDVLVIGPPAEGDRPVYWNPPPFEPYGPARRSRRSRWARRGLTIGLGLSLFGVMFAFLEDHELALGFFCLLSLVLFLLLVRPARKG